MEDVGLKAKEYLGSEVLVGEEGNSFYGSRFGCSFRCSVEVWFLWSRILRVYGFVDSFVDFQR